MNRGGEQCVMNVVSLTHLNMSSSVVHHSLVTSLNFLHQITFHTVCCVLLTPIVHVVSKLPSEPLMILHFLWTLCEPHEIHDLEFLCLHSAIIVTHNFIHTLTPIGRQYVQIQIQKNNLIIVICYILYRLIR